MTTLKSAIKSIAFDWANPEIEKHFSYETPRNADYKLFHFDRDIESEDAVKEIEKEGYSAATLSELIAYAKYGWNDEDLVVALGSVARVSLGRGVPYLGGSGAGRRLSLGWWGGRWPRYYRFLAVRNSSLGHSDIGASTSDPLTLESLDRRLRVLEGR